VYLFRYVRVNIKISEDFHFQ